MIKITRLLFFLLSFSIVSQNETINWYFGNKAAIKFENGRIINLDNSEMNAPANSSSISDENGQLLFYSDGTTIWNRNHEIMENGDGLFGENTHFQSVIIIPNPANNKSYFLIYARQFTSSNLSMTPGIYFSEIIFGDTFPLGKVSDKNIKVASNSPSEKITAVHHKDGEKIWLVTLTGTDNVFSKPKKQFNVFLIDETGFNRAPILKTAGYDIENLGAMKLSPDGKKLFITANTTNDGLRFLHEYNFDNETGNLTFVNNFLLENTFAVWPSKGIEFSPNGKFLYIGYSNGNRNGIIQYEIGNLDPFDEPRSFLFSELNLRIESLQLANDQKIYVALTSATEDGEFIGVIENPDEKGNLAGFRKTGFRLSPNSSKKGLPNFIQSYFASKITTENKCYIEEFTFSSTSYAPITEVFWDFGDGNTATGINTTHTFSTPGIYLVKAILKVGTKNVTVYKTVIAFALPVLKSNQELVECDEDLDGLSTFNLLNIRDKILSRGSTDTTDFYLSQADISTDTKISNPENFQNTIPNQEIFVKVTNENGCFETTSFLLKTRFVSLGNIADVYVCEDSDGIIGNAKGEFDTFGLETSISNQLNLPNSSRLSFYPTFQDAQTNTNKYLGTFIENSRTIFLKVLDADASCGGIKPFNIVVNSEPKINLQDEYSICFIPSSKPPVILSADITNDTFEWRNSAGNVISFSQNFTLTTVGEFSLTVYKTENNLSCSNTKTFKVVNPTPPEFSKITVNTEDETNNKIEVFINGNSFYEFSLDNINFSGSSNFFTFSNVPSGLRTIYIRDINSCEEPIQKTISVIGYKKYFTPNGDGDNDFWNIEGLDSASFKSISIHIFDRYGKIIASIIDFTNPGWDGSFNGKNLPANNYWFISEIIDKDNNVIKKSGNFSLIRN